MGGRRGSTACPIGRGGAQGGAPPSSVTGSDNQKQLVLTRHSSGTGTRQTQVLTTSTAPLLGQVARDMRPFTAVSDTVSATAAPRGPAKAGRQALTIPRMACC